MQKLRPHAIIAVSVDQCSSHRTVRMPAKVALAAFAAVAALASPLVRANSQTWNGASTTDGNWSDTLNWVGGAAPGATSGTTNTDVATFNAAISANGWGTSATPVIIDQSSQNIGGITFDAAAGAYFIGQVSPGNSLLLSSGGAITLGTTAASFTGTNTTETINAPLVLEPASGTAAGTYTFINNSTTATDLLSFGGGISGGTTTLGITLTLSGANAPAAVGGASNTISGIIADGGAAGGVSISKTGTGTWILSGPNTYSGTTNITAGVLNLQNNSALGSGTSTVVVNGATASVQLQGGVTINGRALTLTGNSSTGALESVSGNNVWGGNITVNTNTTRIFSDAGSLTLNGTMSYGTNEIVFEGAGPGTIAGAVSGSGIFDHSTTGTGIWTISGPSNYTGQTAIGNGGFNFTNGNALTTTSSITVSSGATIQFGASLGVTSNAPMTLNGGGVAGSAGAFENLAGFTNTFGGLINLSGSATISSDAGGSLSITNAGAITGAGATLTLTGAGNGSVASIIGTTTGGLTKSLAGTWTVSGASTYTGATTVNAGTLTAGVASVAGVSGAFGNNSAVTIGNVAGATLNLAGFNTQIASLAGGGTTGGAVTLGGATLTVAGSTSTSFAGVISGAGNLALSGTGTLTLSGNNTFGGSSNSITLGNTAQLNINSATALGNAGNTLIINGGTLDNTTTGVLTIGANPETWNASFTYGGTHTITTAGNISLTNNVTYTDNGANGGQLILNGNISGNFILSKAGTQGLTLGGTNTFASLSVLAGTVTGTSAGAFSSGTIALGATSGSANATLATSFAGNIPNAISVVAGNTGTASLSSTATTAFTGPITLANNLTVSAPTTSTTLTLGGAISGSGSLTLSGTNSTLVLSGANGSFTGPVTLTAGTLIVASTTATGSGNVTLNGGTLASSAAGTVPGNVVEGTGTHLVAPGGVASVGTLTIGGNLTTTSATTLTFDETAPWSGSPANTGDLLVVNGTFSATATPVIFGSTPQANGEYRLIQSGNATALAAALVLPTPTNNRLTYSWDPSTDTGYLDLNVTVGGSIVAGSWLNAAIGTTSWTLATNWSGGNIPGVAGDTALLNTAVPAGVQTIQLNGQQHLASLTFTPTSTGTYTIAQNGSTDSLVMDNGSSGATITNTSLNNIISAPVVLASNTGVTVTAGTLTMSGSVSGSGTLGKAGSGTLNLTAANTFTGATTVTAGGLLLSNANALAGTTSITAITGSGYVALAGNITVPSTNAPITISGQGSDSVGDLQNSSGNNTWAANVILTGGTVSTTTTDNVAGGTTRIGSAGGILTISGVISGTAGSSEDVNFRNNGGSVIISGNNSYTGATEIGDGTVQLGSANSLPGTTVLNLGLTTVTATLDLNGFSPSVAGLVITPGVTANGQLVTNTSTTPAVLTLTTASAQTYNNLGSISGANLSLVKLGASTFTLGTSAATGTGTYNYGGSTTIGNGTFIMGNNAVFSANPTTLAFTTLNFGATAANSGTGSATAGIFDLHGFSNTVGGLSVVAGSASGSQIVNNSSTAGALTVNLLSGSNTFSGALGASGQANFAFTLTGAGTLTLSGTNIYTGATGVNGGVLNITGSLGNTAVTVSSATLAGNGSIAGSVNLTGTGKLAPSIVTGVPTGPATPLTLTGGVTLAGTSSYAVNLVSTSAYDETVIGSGAAATLGGSALTVNDSGYSAPTIGAKFWIVDGVAGSLAVSGAFANGASVVGASGNTYAITYDASTLNGGTEDPLGSGNDVLLTLTSLAPEPGSLGLLALGAVGLLARRRSARRTA